MLNHYTNSVDTAISILTSQSFRMTRSSLVSTDNNEINHMLDIINKMNEFKEIKGKVETSQDRFRFRKVIKTKSAMGKNAQKGLYRDIYLEITRCLVTKYYYDNNIAIGNLLSKVLRDETYMACFTEEDYSAHHLGVYGDVCFTFNTNNVFQHIDGFQFLSNEILYLDTERFSLMGKIASQFVNYIKETEGISNQKYLDQIYEEILSITYPLNTYNNKIHNFTNRFLELTKENCFESELVREIEASASNVLSQLGFNYTQVVQYVDERTRNLRQASIKPFLNDENLAQHYNGIPNPLAHFGNLPCCFIKSVNYKDDKEYRIIALPTQLNQVTERYITVPINMDGLVKITLNPKMQNKIEAQTQIQQLLKQLGLSHVQVV
ncbi:hypothetical protein ACIQ1D_18410 [Lysinibacillus xylanilyticus]|uniref:hypothetical protein n=1 Tax=Lysinibacillus xylanilyticus TaxID=582475 RepID=UPI0037F7D607